MLQVERNALGQMRFTAMRWQALKWEKMHSGRIELQLGWGERLSKQPTI